MLVRMTFRKENILKENKMWWSRVAGRMYGGKESGGVSQHPLEHEPAMCPDDPKGQQYPGLYQK